MSDNTILAYARRHELAIDYKTHLPALNAYIILGQEASETHHDDHTLSQDIQALFGDLITDASQVLSEPKVKLTVTECQFLSSAISRPVVENPFSESFWQILLPDHRIKSRLKLPEPLLTIGGGDVIKDVQGVKKGIDLDMLLQDIKDSWKQDHGREYAKTKREDDAHINELLQTRDMFQGLTKQERIQVSREVFCLLGEAIKKEDMNASMPDLYAKYLQAERPQKLARLPIMLSMQDLIDFTDDHDDDDNLINGVQGSNQEALVRLSEVRLRSEDSKVKTDLFTAVKEAIDDDIHFGIDDEHNQEWLDAAIAITSPRNEERYNDIGKDFMEVSTEPAYKRRKIAQDLRVDVSLLVPSLPGEKHTASSNNLSYPGVSLSPGLPVKVEQTVENRHTVSGDPHIVEDFDIELAIQGLLKTEPCLSDDMSQALEIMKSFDEELIKLSDQAAAETKGTIASESLDSAPTLTKMKLPNAAFQSMLLNPDTKSSESLIDQYLDGQIETIKIDRKQELELNWLPFATSASRQSLVEAFDDDYGCLNQLIAQPQNIVKSHQLLWKEPGLRVLESEEVCAEELELCSETESCTDVSRNAESNDHFTKRTTQPSDSTKTDEHSHASKKTQKPLAEHVRNQVSYQSPKSGPPVSSINYLLSKTKPRHEVAPKFSASHSLSSFLDLRGKKFVKPKIIADHIARESSEDPIQSSHESEEVTTENATESPTDQTNDSRSCSKMKSCVSYVLSPRVSLNAPRTIVANNVLLQSHLALVSYLEEQGGSDLTIIYRDLDPKFEVCPDLILNPTAALVYTSTQLLAQRPLPGQDKSGELSPTHHNISKLAASFDNVIVIVTHNNSVNDTTSSVGSIVVTKFVAFCALLSTSENQVRVLWLRHDHPESLIAMVHAWTWSCIAQHAFPDPKLPLNSDFRNCHNFIQDETLWELFLRKAGMNPLAAQVVLGVLKRPDDKTDSRGNNSSSEVFEESWGLSRFVSMCSEKRQELFGDALGRRGITAINNVINQYM